MEKKTIGKFISALRRASGMTQRELGDRLFVSDKTVSRWERDECTPELSLIPVIAEIFGITTDELLRGERNGTDASESDAQNASKRARSRKQFRLMLGERMKRNINLTMISVGITILGLIVAVICNVSFSKGLLGFCLASVCFVASIIFQMLFLINSVFLIDDEDEYDEECREELTDANTSMLKTAVAVICGVVVLWAFCLPIVVFTAGGVNFGLTFDSWLPMGAIFAAIAFIALYVIYHLFLKTVFVKNGALTLTDREKSILEIRKHGIKLAMTVFGISLCVLLIVVYVVESIGIEPYLKKLTFETVEDFETFTKQRYDEWFEEEYGYLLEQGMSVEEYNRLYESQKEYKVLERANGAVMLQYYHSKSDWYNLRFDGDDLVPITVITQQAIRDGRATHENIIACLYVGIAVAFVACTAWYVVYVLRKKN